MKHYLSLIALLLLLAGCRENEVYSKFDRDFPENRWQGQDVKTYNFDITDESQTYDLVFHFSHVYGYQFASVPLQFSLIGPDKQLEQKQIDLPLKDASGQELGDCSGDYCDLDYTFLKEAQLQKGHYALRVSQLFKGPYLPNVLGVGLTVETNPKK